MLIWTKKPEHHKVKKYEKFFKAYIKMEKTVLRFGDIEIEKEKISPA